MSETLVSLKLKVISMGVAAMVGGLAFLGSANTADASFVCSLDAPKVGKGECWNENDSSTNSLGDFRNDAGWQANFTGGGKKWNAFDFTTTNLLNSQFATQKAFGAQDADKVETTLEGSDWFGQDLTLVADGNFPDTDLKEFRWKDLGGNVLYIHVGGYSMAWLFGGDGPFPFAIEGVGKGLSNYRIYSTVTAVPLPGALPLFGAALIGLGFVGRRRMLKAKQNA